MHRINAPIKNIRVQAYDGTEINTFICGNGPHKWLLTPGLGTPVYSWRYLFEYFKDKMTIVTWEPRGLYSSGVPDDLSRLKVLDHVKDGLAIEKAVGWENEEYVTGGWSMGIQIGLEIYKSHPERIKALALLNGTFEHVVRTAFPVPGAYPVLKSILKASIAASPVVSPFSQYILGRSWAIDLLKKLGLVSANREFFGEVLTEFKQLDFGVYFPLILELNKHSARDILPKVKVPTLVTAGTMDKITPLFVSKFIHEQIDNSELFIIPTGTHYTTIEFPEIINLKLDQFFGRRVFKEEW